ncbi:hypothetical protein [Halobacillus naozhouensis]|uniref:SMODS and SLOG-associating 2TM effector domain-containing protein n=1 Tax=Halobacillus naozhouensis TaxID=554880 RepID=A0ABY8J0Q2_9BACI|nr:hypothetical protein [Halobacillus naozhouensis]WFT76065.1 hypothetical protein P9989_06795 [Halobacillus naozhouensis]
MNHLSRKVLSFRDINYQWVLVTSILIFMATLYADLYEDPSYVPLLAVSGYGIALLVGGIWGAMNYIGHVRVNMVYRKNNDIPAFVDNLAIDREEKLELQAYLEDYTKDLVSQGKDEEEAVKLAIDHFKIKEFSSLSKDTQIFNLHAHYYLWGYTGIAGVLCLSLLYVTNAVITSSLTLIVLEATLFAYGFGFAALFFVYKLLDTILYSKL